MLYRSFEKEHTMNVYNYETQGGKDLIVEYILSLSKPEIIDGLSVIDKFKNGELNKLDIRPWRGKVSEVYFYKHNRIFYVIIEDSNIYLLHACRKQKNKTEKNDCDIVIKRAKELGNMLSVKLL
jgi:phage-related protein